MAGGVVAVAPTAHLLARVCVVLDSYLLSYQTLQTRPSILAMLVVSGMHIASKLELMTAKLTANVLDNSPTGWTNLPLKLPVGVQNRRP